MIGLPDRPGDLLGLRPGVDSTFTDLYRSVWTQGVDGDLLEACRLRMAQMFGATGPLHRRTPGTDVEVSRLADWHRDPEFDPTIADALAFAEQFLLDPNAIDDDRAARLRDELGDTGLTTLVVALAVFESYQRMCVMFDLVASGPDHLCVAPGPHWTC